VMALQPAALPDDAGQLSAHGERLAAHDDVFF
jgi:hypothetical protein